MNECTCMFNIHLLHTVCLLEKPSCNTTPSTLFIDGKIRLEDSSALMGFHWILADMSDSVRVCV